MKKNKFPDGGHTWVSTIALGQFAPEPIKKTEYLLPDKCFHEILKELEFKYGEEIEVRDDEMDEWQKATFICKTTLTEFKYLAALGQSFVRFEEIGYGATVWNYARKIQKEEKKFFVDLVVKEENSGITEHKYMFHEATQTDVDEIIAMMRNKCNNK